MTGEYVLDASVVIAWMLNSQANTRTDELLDRAEVLAFVAPRHLAAEVRNVLAKSERIGRLRRDETDQALQILAALDLRFDEPESDTRLRSAMDLARAHDLSFYDALYVELAHRSGVALASRDRKQLAAAKACGLDVYDALGVSA